ncbi:MAG: tyrosine--tRNA ligase [Anaerolineales bacterium]|nr:tyrosine--tRNA ligase [Anaerolineales bacterium]
MSKPAIDQQVALLMQGTEYGDEALKQAMAAELRERLIQAGKEDRPLRVYAGYDPTSSDLHLGHTVTMRKLRQFQELGHSVVFLIGDYTALVGDPSDKNALRPQLVEERIKENARTYADQAFRILDRGRTEVRHNSEWLSRLSFAELIRLGSNFTVQQFTTRENFRLRWDRGDAIYLHEFFYSIMQGYDAYALRADVQVGGTEQLFNIITAGRKVMEHYGVRPNIGVLLGILPGTDGVVRMSKSLGNHIPLMAEPGDMYGKVMSVPDSAMGLYFKLLTRFTPEKIAAVERDLQSGALHPRDAKMNLAREIVEIYHGPEAAAAAEQQFRLVFQQSELPEEIPSLAVAPGMRLVDVMTGHGLAKSKSDARRLIEQGGVKLGGATVRDPNAAVSGEGDPVLQVGKRRFVRLTKAG